MNSVGTSSNTCSSVNCCYRQLVSGTPASYPVFCSYGEGFEKAAETFFSVLLLPLLSWLPTIGECMVYAAVLRTDEPLARLWISLEAQPFLQTLKDHMLPLRLTQCHSISMPPPGTRKTQCQYTD